MVVRTLHGRVLLWRSLRAPAYTSNEAEYQAAIAGLRLMQQRFPGIGVCCLTDSQVVVQQVTGQAAVRAAALRPLYVTVTTLVQQMGRVAFVPIPRDLNRLADSLAWEALTGQHQVRTRTRAHTHSPHK